MPQFTQLNLNTPSAKSAGNTPARDSASRTTTARTRTTMFAGLVAIAVLSGAALLALNGCSKKEAVKSEVTSATQPNISPSPATVTPTSPATETQSPTPVKKPKKSPSVTYVNRTYGLSLQYPRKYSLKTGDDAQLELNGSPMPMDFAKAGGVTVAAFEMPHGMYPGTDLNQAFLMVNVNRNLSEAECGLQVPQTVSEAKPVSDEKQISESKALESSSEKVKIAGREFTEDEKGRTESTSQSEARYYHAFENGSCYEFALGLSTKPSESENETKPVDRDAVFGKLEKILATVKIKSPVPTESPNQVVGDSSAPATQPASMSSSAPQVGQQQFEPTPVHPE